jgi:hypothetical protein
MMKKLLSLAGLEINRMETDLSERFSTTWEDLGKRKKMKKDLEKNTKWRKLLNIFNFDL